MSGCDQSKSTSKSITVNIIDPGTVISGPSIVCSSGATFTINTLPEGSTVFWESSFNLNEVSGQGTTAYTVTTSGGGIQTTAMQATTMAIILPPPPPPPAPEEPGSSGWVRATISNSCGTVPIEKVVWAGLPGFKPVVTGPTAINCGQYYLYTEQDYRPIYWSVASSMSIIGPSGPGRKCTVMGLEFAAAGVIGTVSNECGSFTDILEVDISCSNVSFSPNPASSVVEVAINEKVTDTATDLSISKVSSPDSDSPDYTVRITNAYGVPFYTSKKSGNCFSVSVADLKDGVYIVNISNGKTKYSKQLVVKH